MLFVLGCSTEQKEQPETEYVTVNLDFSPDYEIQPLVKSSIGDNDYVVLQVDLLTDNDPYAGVQTCALPIFISILISDISIYGSIQ